MSKAIRNFGRNQYNDPCTNESQCHGYFVCDGDCDADDVIQVPRRLRQEPIQLSLSRLCGGGLA